MALFCLLFIIAGRHDHGGHFDTSAKWSNQQQQQQQQNYYQPQQQQQQYYRNNQYGNDGYGDSFNNYRPQSDFERFNNQEYYDRGNSGNQQYNQRGGGRGGGRGGRGGRGGGNRY